MPINQGMELDVVTAMCIAVANYLIEKTNEHNEGKTFREKILMSGKRLQKLLYFSDVAYLVKYGERMIEDDFYAWPSGPVIPSVYKQFIQYQSGDMRPAVCENNNLTKEQRDILDAVFNATVNRKTNDLILASHATDGPWHSIYDDSDLDNPQIISEEAVLKFYKNMEIDDMLDLRPVT